MCEGGQAHINKKKAAYRAMWHDSGFKATRIERSEIASFPFIYGL